MDQSNLVRRGGIYFDVPPQCSTPDTAHGQWVRYIEPSVENIFLGLRPLKIFLPWVQYNIPIFHAEG